VRRAATIEAAGVVVPAHNEEGLLPACLVALRRAVNAVGIPVQVLVVADTCTDQTAVTAQACGVRVTSIRARNVGVARAAGMTELLRLTAGRDPAAVWLATTDADTVVPPGWLRRQLSYAGRGWDVVLGTVEVADWDEYPPHVPAAFDALYESGTGPHPHVHGANLGIRASAYLAAGGFRPLRTAEDHALLAAATEAGCPVVQAGDLTVQTSGRRQARAPRGFSHLLRTLAPLPNAPAGSLSPRVARCRHGSAVWPEAPGNGVRAGWSRAGPRRDSRRPPRRCRRPALAYAPGRPAAGDAGPSASPPPASR
jgi:hypothetical protein